MEEHQLERQIFRAPQGTLRAETNVTILIVGECLQFRRRLVLDTLIRRSRGRRGSLYHVFESEGVHRPDLQGCKQQANEGQPWTRARYRPAGELGGN
jgi:hypothetical protein